MALLEMKQVLMRFGGLVAVDAPDGTYPNLADGGSVEVKFGRVTCQGRPIIFESRGQAGCGAEEAL